jgi:hypothetical protein
MGENRVARTSGNLILYTVESSAHRLGLMERHTALLPDRLAHSLASPGHGRGRTAVEVAQMTAVKFGI